MKHLEDQCNPTIAGRRIRLKVGYGFSLGSFQSFSPRSLSPGFGLFVHKTNVRENIFCMRYKVRTHNDQDRTAKPGGRPDSLRRQPIFERLKTCQLSRKHAAVEGAMLSDSVQLLLTIRSQGPCLKPAPRLRARVYCGEMTTALYALLDTDLSALAVLA